MVYYGQLVIGPPGSGKSTYCHGMQQYFQAVGRKCALVNLDPANEGMAYECTVDIAELITVDDVMAELGLGPNGAMLYCMEYLQKNLDWLHDKLKPLLESSTYIVIDCPGQAELYLHHSSMRTMATALTDWGWKLVCCHLVDAHYCSEPSKYISVLMVSLLSMLHLELPHVNVLSKIDLIETFGKLDLGLDFYIKAGQGDLLSYLAPLLQKDPALEKHRQLSTAICELVEDYGLVSFVPLCITDKRSVMHVVQTIDRANGYVFGSLEGSENYVEDFNKFAVKDLQRQNDEEIKRLEALYMKKPSFDAPIGQTLSTLARPTTTTDQTGAGTAATTRVGGSSAEKGSTFKAAAKGGGGSSAPVERTCSWCQKKLAQGTAKRCSYCQRVFYCGRECQRKHWTAAQGGHKKSCTRSAQKAKDRGQDQR
jgi:GTPase SAR1 family protein